MGGPTMAVATVLEGPYQNPEYRRRLAQRAQPECQWLEKSMRKVPYPSPGEILLEEFPKPMGITQYRLAKDFLFCCFDRSKQNGVSQRRVSEIVAGSRAITVDIGLRLAKKFLACPRASGWVYKSITMRRK